MSAQESKKKRKRPRDLNQLAASITVEATETDNLTVTHTPEDEKNPAAVELGRLGGLKGGKARAAKLTSEERSEIARRAAAVRWSKKSEEKK